MFPCVKTKEPNSKIISDIFLIKNTVNCKKIQYEDTDRDIQTNSLLMSGFSNIPGFVEADNNFASFSQKRLQIFDQDM